MSGDVARLLLQRDPDYEYVPKVPPPEPDDSWTTIDVGTIGVDAETGEDVFGYFTSPLGARETGALRSAIEQIEHWEGTPTATGEARLSGIQYTHQVFGVAEPVPMRRRYGCSRCRMTEQYPDLDALLESASRQLTDQFERRHPGIYARHAEAMDDVADLWRFGGSAWTSGIINHLAAIPMHKDAGNLKGTWSAMLGLRRYVEGGVLIVPAYKVVIPVADRSVLFFSGAETGHGVSPLAPTARTDAPLGARRTTIVFYAKRGIVNCAPTIAEEIDRARRARDASETRIAEALLEDDA